MIDDLRIQTAEIAYRMWTLEQAASSSDSTHTQRSEARKAFSKMLSQYPEIAAEYGFSSGEGNSGAAE